MTVSKEPTAYAHSMTRPLNLRQMLRTPARGLAWIPWLDFCILAFFFTLQGSPFLFAPGVNFDLPHSAKSNVDALPFAAVLTVLPVVIVDDTVTANTTTQLLQRTRVIFNGEIFTVNNLKPKLDAFIKDSSGQRQTLLVKADQQVTIQLLLAIFEIARDSGFDNVQLATRTAQVSEEVF